MGSEIRVHTADLAPFDRVILGNTNPQLIEYSSAYSRKGRPACPLIFMPLAPVAVVRNSSFVALLSLTKWIALFG